MQTHLKPAERKVLNYLKRAASKKSLGLVLSPLEKAVLTSASQPFNYRFNGITVYISMQACKQLLTAVVEKLRLLNFLIQRDKIRPHIPFELREVIDDPREILSLSPRLRNKLCELECYTLFAISKKGRRYFVVKQKFSKPAMQTLDALFAKHKCANLFN